MSGIIKELKRRNVFKVGAAYLVGSWILVQVADVLFEAIGTPEWVIQTMLVFLGLGFFVALFFAWAFELTPEGVKRESEVDRTQSITDQTGKKLNNTILVMMALAIAYLLFDKFSGPGAMSTPDVDVANSAAQQGAVQPAQPAEDFNRQSIAVLPFDNRSPDPADAFFTQGVHDDLLTTLSRIKSLKVISRTSVEKYGETELSIPEIARELGVANIMEGAVQRAGNQVRINVQLIDAQTDEHLWAEIFDRELTAENLFAIQSEISQAIADQLAAALSPEEQQRLNRLPTENLAAYDDYLRARQLVETRITANLQEAQRLFRSAVDADPDFALAWVGVADTVNLLTQYGTFSVASSIPLRRDAIDRALALDPNLGEAYVSLAVLLADEDARANRARIEQAFKRGIELNPNYARAYQWYAVNILEITRTQEVVDLARKARELDPRSPIMTSMLAGAYTRQGLFSLAEQQYLENIELNPGFAQAYRSLADFYAFNVGRMDRAVELNLKAQELDSDSAFAPLTMALYLTELGLFEEAGQYRDALASMNDQDWRLGMTELMLNSAQGRNDAVRETWNWLKSRAPSFGFIAQVAATTLLAAGDLDAARAIYLDLQPEWLDPEQWDYLIDINTGWACNVGWTLLNTGDEALGRGLIEKSVAFMDALPGFVEHADSNGQDTCYLAAGQADKALKVIETQLAHNHLFWMELNSRMPMYESIRYAPRYQAVLEERGRRLAEQREAIAQMDLL
jgi:TolB-like protein